jgi:UDP-glucose 4-epimerase
MRWFLCGGAGFIGSHFVDTLLQDPQNSITIYDNFSSGRPWHYQQHCQDDRFKVITGDVEDTDRLEHAMCCHDVVIHLASNPDISKAMTQPDIDFWQGTVLTNSVLEAMRRSQVKRLLYASGSGVYGDIGYNEGYEDNFPLRPISTYGASKLAGEALIRSYTEMFDITACAFRFGNVIGARQTHGVGLDFTKKLLKDPTKLLILGNGKQSKSYVHVSDIVSAVLLANKKLNTKFEVYNVATKNYITVNNIVKIIQECLDIKDTKLEYTGGNRGWKGDVPIVRLNSYKIRNLGWKNKFTTEKAIRQSVLDMLPDIKSGKM